MVDLLPTKSSTSTEEFLRDISFQSCWVILTSFVLVVNKYILTSLGFQFPTVFLGWQTLATLLILKLDTAVFRSSKTNLTAKWNQIPSFFPVILLHLTSLYAGSRSLSRLHLHVFLPLQNFRLVLREIFEIVFAVAQRLFPHPGGSKAALKSLPKPWTGLLLLLISACGAAVRYHDLDFSSSGYRWLALHCAAAAASDTIVALSSSSSSPSSSSSSSELSPRERALAKNTGCFLLLATGSLLTGEVSLASEFPHWRLYRFYLATFASGCLGGARLVFAFGLRQYLFNANSSPSSSSTTPSARTTKSALTSEWNRLISELNVSAKAVIAIISFAYCWMVIFPTAGARRNFDVFVFCFCLTSLGIEWTYYRLQSTLPSIPFHFISACSQWLCLKRKRRKRLVVLA